jgi:hypothetical protein
MVRRLLVVLAALGMATGAQAGEGRMAMKHATGSFEVTITPEAQGDAPADGVPTSRMALRKTFSGALTGEALGTMLAAGTPAAGNAASYVAIDQVSGTLDGRKGGFVLVHRGTMTKAGGRDLSVIVAPDSGTGALEGINGTFSIEVKDGKHFYDLAYSLPEGR